jgi:hypothetical protein
MELLVEGEITFGQSCTMGEKINIPDHGRLLCTIKIKVASIS